MTTTFTTDEEKNLTAHDAAAHDLMRFEAAGTLVPCWLVCSDETRTTYRQRILDTVLAKGIALLPSNPVALFEQLVPRHLLDAWRAAELDAKAGREVNDPRAFFA